MIGDFLFAQSAILAAATGSTRVVSIFAGSLGDICDGQLREMIDAHRIEQNRADYEKRIYGKTASLLPEPLRWAPSSATRLKTTFRQFANMAAMSAWPSRSSMTCSMSLRNRMASANRPATTSPGNRHAPGDDVCPRSHAWQRCAAHPRCRHPGEIEDSTAIDDVVHAIRASSAIDETLEAARIFTEQAKRQIEIIPDPHSRDMLAEIADLALRRVSSMLRNATKGEVGDFAEHVAG